MNKEFPKTGIVNTKMRNISGKILIKAAAAAAGKN